MSWFNHVHGGGSWCNSGHLAFGSLGQCKPDQVVKGPKAAWGVAGVRRGQRAPAALLAVVRLTASASNKTKNHLDGIIVNFPPYYSILVADRLVLCSLFVKY